MDVTLEEPGLEKEDIPPWGLWETVGFSIAVIAVYFLVPVLMIRAALGAEPATPEQYLQVAKDPGMLCLSAIFSSLTATCFIIFFSRLRPQIGIKEYLGVKRVRPGAVFFWVIAFLIATYILGVALMFTNYKPPESVSSILGYNNIPLVVTAIVVITPVFEEFLYRGFMLKGIESASGPTVAIMLSSLFFALTHLQYNIYGISFVFIIGLILGYGKVKTKSIYTPIAMHSTMNLLMLIMHRAFMYKV